MAKNSKNQKLKVLFAAYECAPFLKIGGLGDVAGSLPKALSQLDVDIRVVMPKYKNLNLDRFKSLKLKKGSLKPKNSRLTLRVHQATLPKSSVPVYFIDLPKFFNRKNIFGYKDDQLRFAQFARAVTLLRSLTNWRPIIIHCNDWQTALIPALVKKTGLPVKTLMTIHNLAYQGLSQSSLLTKIGLKVNDFPEEQALLKWSKQVNQLQSGILLADAVSTVSPSYAQEILKPNHGFGLTKTLQRRRRSLTGITNGLGEDWNPSIDTCLPYRYSVKNLKTGKLKNKLYLQSLLNLSQKPKTPLLSLIARLTKQKGVELIIKLIPLLASLNAQLVILGRGDKYYEQKLKQLTGKFTNLSLNIKFDTKLARLIYAASDIFLMPSLFEPCGLSQLIAMKYGTIPIVRATGGLKDTVINYHPKSKNLNTKKITATGFIFSQFSSTALANSVKRAIKIYLHQPNLWQQLQINGVKQDFSWSPSAHEYLNLYQSLINRT